MQEKTIQLRSGQALLLRQVHPEDARAMLNYLERTSAETHFMVRLPEEVTFSLRRSRRFWQTVCHQIAESCLQPLPETASLEMWRSPR